MGKACFSERADGVAFWSMMLLSLVFMVYSYVVAHMVDWLLIFVPIIGLFFIFRFVWTVFAWHKPSSIEIEKVERVAFFGTSLSLLVVLIIEYVATGFFNFYVFYVFIAGLLIKTILSSYSLVQSS
ncbi:MAG: hypothetical protein QXX59_08680 [Candidatus Bathyarchaeia archaeon]